MLLKSSHSRRLKPEPHVVPLSPLALGLLRRLKELAGESEYVLPAYASKKGRKSYTERVLTRAVRENEKHFGIPHWTPHDLRRTCRTGMSGLKGSDGKPAVEPHIAERVLNHAQPGIAGVYDRFAYLDEKRAALEKWGEHLQAIIEGREQTVVPMVRHG